MHHFPKARLLAAGTALWALANPAFALDGNDLVKKINNAMYLESGAGLVPGTVSVDGGSVTLSDTRFELGNGHGGFPLGKVEMEGVSEEDGGYLIDTITFENISAGDAKSSITVSDISLSGVSVPADPNGNTLDALLLYEEGHIGPMAISVEGKPALTVGSTDFKSNVEDDDSAVTFDLKVSDIKSDLAVIDDPQTRQSLSDLGLKSLDGNVSMVGRWDMKPGTLALQEYAIEFADVGRLDLALSFSGYTLDFIRSANETARAMEANPNKEEAQQAANLAMLGLMQRLTFNSAQIRFEDAGITDRALAFAGKKQNASAEQMAQMIKAMTPLALAQYNMPDLQNMLSAAVNTYLDNPKNLTITAQPQNGVPFPMIMGAAMGAPNTLPQVLGVTVTAND